MNTKKNVALLCDYGLDDAIATLYLLKHADSFNKIDILPVAGNFPLELTYINAKRLLSHLNFVPKNVRIVNTLSIPQKSEAIYEIHGNDGMGDVLPLSYNENVPVINYESWIDEVDSTYVIVSLGPCTVTSDILQKKKSVSLIMMAGNISEPPNYNGYEFNHGVNPKAFAEVVKYPHVSATLDTCHCRFCDLYQFNFSTEELIGKMLARYFEMSQNRNESVCSVYDLTAVTYLIHPEKFEINKQADQFGNNISVLKYIADEPIIQ